MTVCHIQLLQPPNEEPESDSDTKKFHSHILPYKCVHTVSSSGVESR